MGKIKIITSGTIALLTVLIAAFSSLSVIHAVAGATTSFGISAPSGYLVPGAQFEVNIGVQPGEALAGAQFNLSFDPTVVTVNSVKEGNLLDKGNASTFFNPGQIDNNAGSITGIMGVITTPGQMVVEAGSIAILNLTAVATGHSALTLSGVIAGSPNGQSLAVVATGAQIRVDQPPQLVTGGNRQVDENSPLNFAIAASDPDADSLTLAAFNLPSGAIFNPLSRIFSWTPTYSQAGSYSVQFQVSDGQVEVTENITITVNPVNRAPTLDPIANKSVNEGTRLAFSITGSDPDGDKLNYTAANLPSGASFDPNTRIFAWTPNYSQAGTYSLQFQVSDGALLASQALSINVVNVNRAPILNSIGNKNAKVSTLITFTITGSDPDGNALTYSASGLPAGASFNAATRVFAWTPKSTQSGTFTNLRFQVSDGALNAYETISITVKANVAPVMAAIANPSVKTGTLLTFTVTATDGNGDTLTYSASGLPSGAWFNSSTHVFSWVPSATQKGVFKNVRFTVSDGTASVFKTINITVTAGVSASASAATTNKAPALNPISNQSIKAGRTLTFTITGSDPNGDKLKYGAANLPSGSKLDSSTGQFTWTPTAAQIGKYSQITFSVSDGHLSAARTITITVAR
jgi:hypothetical protein